MKSKINVFILIFTMLGLLFTACNKSEDLVTADVKTGGLAYPTQNVPYKLGYTPTVDLVVDVPQGPGISTIEVYNVYYRNADTSQSEPVLLYTIDVASANVTADVSKEYSITFADLRKDITVKGDQLPTDESLMPIGDKWVLSYKSIMADGRLVWNNGKTTIAVANLYAGTYQCVGVFTHPTAGPRPIDEEKFLTPISAYTCNIPAGDLGGSGYAVDITVDPVTNDVSFSNGVPVEILGSTTERSYYDPATGHFFLHYFYIGGGGLARIIDEEYTPL
ncbi:MAG: DUF4361 domain-containing protein [Bacteroidales bacterium]|nr:DUF4361 domain-containing protein [Bacteroidales bacterium]